MKFLSFKIFMILFNILNYHLRQCRWLYHWIKRIYIMQTIFVIIDQNIISRIFNTTHVNLLLFLIWINYTILNIKLIILFLIKPCLWDSFCFFFLILIFDYFVLFLINITNWAVMLHFILFNSRVYATFTIRNSK